MSSLLPDAKREAIAAVVSQTVRETGVYDIHTHLYDPAFGELLLWGIDDQLVYHYLVAEAFRHFDIRSEEHTSELQSRRNLVCRLLLEKKQLHKNND